MPTREVETLFTSMKLTPNLCDGNSSEKTVAKSMGRSII